MRAGSKRGAAVAVAGLAGAAVVAAAFFWRGGPADAGLLRPQDADLVARGAAIYQAQCASCHGADLQGERNWQSPGPDGLMPAPPHDETGHTWHHPDEILFRITKLGVAKAANLQDYRSAMPAYDDVLTDEEIIAALSWIKAQWPEDIQERHDALKAQYAKQNGG